MIYINLTTRDQGLGSREFILFRIMGKPNSQAGEPLIYKRVRIYKIYSEPNVTKYRPVFVYTNLHVT
jgi:hypothetical protein